MEQVQRLREGDETRGEAVEQGSSWNERWWQRAKGSGSPAGGPSANGTWVVQKTRGKPVCTLKGHWTR